MLSGAKVLVKSLESQKVEYIFGLPGTHILAVYDELLNSNIKTILVAHEQGAGFMADAYGRVTRKPAVAMVTSGPWLLNIINSIAQAFVESSPVVLIGSHINQKLWGKGCYHELKHPNAQLNIFQEVTKMTRRISSANEIPSAVSDAFFQAQSDRQRPVFLEIPENVFEEHSTDEQMVYGPLMPSKKLAAEADIELALRKLKAAKTPLIIAGGGVVSARAQCELMAISEFLSIPVLTTLVGKSSCPTDFKNNLGLCSGILASDTAKEKLHNADLVLALGTRFDEVATGFFTLKLPKELIHVDIDANEFNRVYPASMSIVADTRNFLSQLLNMAGADFESLTISQTYQRKKIENVSLKLLHSNVVNPKLLFKRLFDILADKKAIFIGDAGNGSMWLMDCTANLNHLVITPSDYNSMGFSLPGAIGAKLAAPDEVVVAICGDGSFLMTGMEFLTAVRYNIRIVCIVLHDRLYNILTFFQDLKYSARHTNTDITTFDFAKFANDVGGLGLSLESDSEIDVVLGKALSHDGPVLIDTKIDPRVLPPLLDILKKGLAKK